MVRIGNIIHLVRSSWMFVFICGCVYSNLSTYMYVSVLLPQYFLKSTRVRICVCLWRMKLLPILSPGLLHGHSFHQASSLRGYLTISCWLGFWNFLVLLPENGEAMQILRYELGQKYEPHFDSFADEVNRLRGGQRIATVLMYLSDVKKGGETVFPKADVSDL